MASHRITVRVPKGLEALLRNRSRAKGKTPSDLVRIALESYLGRATGARSAYELAEAVGLIGCVRRAPKDLSTGRHHLNARSVSFQK